MKKFIAGLAIGHILTNALYLYLDGGVDRAKFILEYLKEHPGETPHFAALVEYFIVGDPPTQADQAVETWRKRIKLIRAMSVEGYSPAEISDQLNLPIILIQEVVDAEVKPCP